ncbi:hypothetical protein AAIG33_14295 [Phytobacter ursingii]
MRYFQKSSGHVTFRHMGLVEKINDIAMKHQPGGCLRNKK